MALNWTNWWGFFFSNNTLLIQPKCIDIYLISKIHEFVPFRANLTHFGPKSDIINVELVHVCYEPHEKRQTVTMSAKFRCKCFLVCFSSSCCHYKERQREIIVSLVLYFGGVVSLIFK